VDRAVKGGGCRGPGCRGRDRCIGGSGTSRFEENGPNRRLKIDEKAAAAYYYKR